MPSATRSVNSSRSGMPIASPVAVVRSLETVSRNFSSSAPVESRTWMASSEHGSAGKCRSRLTESRLPCSALV